MSNINRNIRWYQPNDPYYYEVDNLPLTDLLNNDITLEDKISGLEARIDSLGDSDPSGVVALDALKDLKAFVALEPGKYGKVFVQPGKFLARMSVPSERESGWRMIGDEASDFNNQSKSYTTSLDSEAAKSKMVARTSIVELGLGSDNYPKGISIPSFDVSEFNHKNPPSERLDLIFVRARASMDMYKQENQVEVGLLKGAYFRTDGTGDQLNGLRFEGYPNTLEGRLTGMSESEVLEDITLPGFGSVPLPEDLLNYEWKNNNAAAIINGEEFSVKQLESDASFCMPVAYIKVPSGFNENGVLHSENIIDIRPFLRTAELTYGERAALSRALNPNGANPFVTQSLMSQYINGIGNDVTALEARVTTIEGQIGSISTDLTDLDVFVKGADPNVTLIGDHEKRIQLLEGAVTSGVGTTHSFIAEETKHIGSYVNLHTQNNWSKNATKTFTLESIPVMDRAKTAFVYLRLTAVRSAGNGGTTQLWSLGPAGQAFPQVNSADLLVFESKKQNDVVTLSSDFVVPVTYDANSDSLKVSLKVTNETLVFTDSGQLIFTGMYITKERLNITTQS